MIQIMYYTQSGFLYTVLFVFHISHRSACISHQSLFVCNKNYVLFVFTSGCSRRAHVLCTLLVCVWYSSVQHILCCVFLLFFLCLVSYPMLSVSLDCPVLIASSVFSNVYLVLFSLVL
jgi:hypothetical protein